MFFAGCAPIPPYERPAAPIPAQWPDSEATATAIVPIGWRQWFTEPELQRLIELALEHNRDLAIAASRVKEARAQLDAASADRLPMLDLSFQQQAARVPADLAARGIAMISRRYDANLGVPAFELDFWGRLEALETAARAQFFASEFSRRAARLALIGEVANAYYTFVEAEQRLQVAQQMAANRLESLRLLRSRREVGLANDLDLFILEAAWHAARAEVSALERQRSQAANVLRVLVGAEMTVSPSASLGQLPPVALGLPADVLLARPDILAAEQKLIAANANLGAARAAYFPRITLTIAAGTASAALSGLFAAGSGAWSFQPVLKWSLFDAGRREANAEASEARREIALAEYEKAIQQAFREVADALAARATLAAQQQALDAQSVAERERLMRVEARLAAGVATALEVLDAQRSLFAVEQTRIATAAALARATASLFKTLGGE
ncbi:MAG: efflux transporter outer membrane subunit [Rhodocyclaceae bacterium]|nr:efflux transporter outer membrane subunit [Rhodocyclaceae bacterium]